MKPILNILAISILATCPAAFADGLPSCGGSVQITNDPSNQQVHVDASGVQACSNIEVQGGSFDRPYKLQGSQGNYSGSYTIPYSSLSVGSNQINVTTSSNSGKHSDVTTAAVSSGSPQDACNPNIMRAGLADNSSDISFNRISGSGNWVYNVQGDYTNGGSALQVTVNSDGSCGVLSHQALSSASTPAPAAPLASASQCDEQAKGYAAQAMGYTRDSADAMTIDSEGPTSTPGVFTYSIHYEYGFTYHSAIVNEQITGSDCSDYAAQQQSMNQSKPATFRNASLGSSAAPSSSGKASGLSAE